MQTTVKTLHLHYTQPNMYEKSMSSRNDWKLHIVPTYLLYIIYGYLLSIILYGQEPRYKIISIIPLNATFIARRIISLDRINCGETRQRFLRAKHCLETYRVKDLYLGSRFRFKEKVPAALAKKSFRSNNTYHWMTQEYEFKLIHSHLELYNSDTYGWVHRRPPFDYKLWYKGFSTSRDILIAILF